MPLRNRRHVAVSTALAAVTVVGCEMRTRQWPLTMLPHWLALQPRNLEPVPGVAISRANGEGRQISVRGLGSEYTRVRVNGMEAIATTGGTVSLVAAGAGVAALAVGLGLTLRRRRAHR